MTRALLRTAARCPAVWLAVASSAAAAVLWSCLPPGAGIDTAAHAYKVTLAQLGASSLWDGFWYGGTYGAATYGYLYYVAASHMGEALLVIGAAGCCRRSSMGTCVASGA